MSIKIDITEEKTRNKSIRTGVKMVCLYEIKGTVTIGDERFKFEIQRCSTPQFMDRFNMKINRPRKPKREVFEFFQARFTQTDYRNRTMIRWIGQNIGKLLAKL